MTKITPWLVLVGYLLLVLAPGSNTKVIVSKINNIPLKPERTGDEPKTCVCSEEQAEPQNMRFNHNEEYEDMESALADIMKHLPFSRDHNYEISYNEYSEGEKSSSEIPSLSAADSEPFQPLKKSEETASNSNSQINQVQVVEEKPKEKPKEIRQVIFIEPPEYIFKHEFNIQPAPTSPRTVIYVFPPEVKHQYNVTDARIPIMMNGTHEPIVYYLNMDNDPNEDGAVEKGQGWDAEKEYYSPVDQNRLADMLPEISSHSTALESKTEGQNYLQLGQLASQPPSEMNADEAGEIINRKVKSINNYPAKGEESEKLSTTKSPPIALLSKKSAAKDTESSWVPISQPFLPFKPVRNTLQDKNLPNHKSITPPTPIYNPNWLIDDVDSGKQQEIMQHSGKSEFEIIPAILQNYFYISPEQTYPL